MTTPPRSTTTSRCIARIIALGAVCLNHKDLGIKWTTFRYHIGAAGLSPDPSVPGQYRVGPQSMAWARMVLRPKLIEQPWTVAMGQRAKRQRLARRATLAAG